jgi:hypothetical protein
VVAGGAGGGGGDSFNSVTCFCGKPFAGRPMIECSSCLTWLHMSCVKVKRKNIPEFYYCDSCKRNGTLLSPSSTTAIGNSASSGEETPSSTITPSRKNGTTTSSNNSIISPDLYGNNTTHQNNQNNSSSSTVSATKSRKPKSTTTTTTTAALKKQKKSSASLMMNSSDNIKNNANSDSKYLIKKSSTVNGKLKKIRETAKKMRPEISSTLAAATSLTSLSLNHHHYHHNVSPMADSSGIENAPSNILKSPIATNNNVYNSSEVMETQTSHENGAINNTIDNGSAIGGGGGVTADKFNNKRLKLL